MKVAAFLLALCVAWTAIPASAQVVSPLNAGSTVDDTARQAAAAAQAAASAACVPMASVPPAETIGGAAGSGSNCRLANAVQPRITRAAIVTTAADGSFSVTWATALAAVPTISLTWVNTGVNTISCELTAAPTTTTVQGRCRGSQTVALNLSIITAGLNLNPFNSGASGVQVHVIALPPAS